MAKEEKVKAGKKKPRIREATAEDLEKILNTEYKGGKLKMVRGRKTKVPALVYKRPSIRNAKLVFYTVNP